ncbi:hypothetical protein Rhe02_37690 [Rhizocola hellebori]|uniref:non-specific serine/threonine protein kinase n=1 Tax=Rhizocola hellebori TaxID=1392758 RepID=A0A8J3Q9A5_9ACTN|nr:hypothetical protein Rhe02_37690 [Rhizocola hellebori]
MPTLIARYGQLLGEDRVEQDRSELMLEIIGDLLAASGVQSRLVRPLVGSSPVLGLRSGERKFFLGLMWSDGPLTAQEVMAWQEAARTRGGLQVALISISGFDAGASTGADAQGPTVVLLDRQHVEAALCGLLTLEEAMDEIGDRTVFDGAVLTSVTELLTTSAPRQDPPPFVSFTRSPMPWDLEIAKADGVSLQHLLSGDSGWPEITGFTVDGARVLVTTDEGVLEVDALRGTTHWLLRLAGCAGSVLAAADGGILVRRGAAVVEWNNGVLTPIAGDLDDARMLLWGPAGQVWALCGNGAELGGSTLGLVRLGGTVGDQQRHSVSFDANVLSAAWLGDLRFFLGSDGYSAVLDLARTTLVRREDWIESPTVPRYLTTSNGDVIMAGSDHRGLRIVLHRFDLSTRTSSLIAELQLNRVQGLCVTSAGRLMLLGDVRGNDVWVPRPVLIEVTLVPPTTTDPPTFSPTPPRHLASPPPRKADPSDESDECPSTAPSAPARPYDAVLLAAHGERKDYALGPRPLKVGGQAEVFPGTHKGTGTAIALKRLRIRGDDQRARMKREVDAGRMFGQNPHVIPILDSSNAHDWLVMPRADHSAEDVAATLRDDSALQALITAICEGLREPHQYGWIHRDLKPANMLWLDGRWVIADWGLGRRPRGQTTMPGRTRVGEFYGSLGYAAPELHTDAHAVGTQTDIFSIGQIIGWALLQTEPRANVPHLPPPGPWRAIVEAATHPDPQQRPATVDDLLTLIVTELEPTRDRRQATVQRHPVTQPAGKPQRTSTGPATGLAFSLDVDLLVEAVTEMLRADDDIPIRRLLSKGVTEARQLHRAGDRQATDQIVDGLTCLAATFLELERNKWFTRSVDSLVTIYGIAFENGPEITNEPPRPAAELWLTIATHAEALGALAVRREHWAAAAHLASRKPSGMRRMYASWFKHATTMANRSDLTNTNDNTAQHEISLVSLGHDVIHRLDYLRPDLEASDDRLLTSLTQFDFLACLHAVHTSGNTTHASGVFHPHFATFHGTRTQPIVQRLLTDQTLREHIHPSDDTKLAAALVLIDKYAKQVGFRYDGWEEYTPDVINFIRANLATIDIS